MPTTAVAQGPGRGNRVMRSSPAWKDRLSGNAAISPGLRNARRLAIPMDKRTVGRTLRALLLDEEQVAIGLGPRDLLRRGRGAQVGASRPSGSFWMSPGSVDTVSLGGLRGR